MSNEVETPSISDAVVAYIRTYVPIAWGTLIAFLVGQGIDIPALSNPALVAGFLVPACIAAWYALGRTIEQRWPAVGRFMMGSKKQPTYAPQNPDGSYTVTDLVVDGGDGPVTADDITVPIDEDALAEDEAGEAPPLQG